MSEPESTGQHGQPNRTEELEREHVETGEPELEQPETEQSEPEQPETDLATLAREFTAALAREQDLAERREMVITRLHDELERLRRGEVELALDLVRRPLIRLHDQILRQADAIEAPLSAERLTALLRALADETADALAATGVERYLAQPGELYDSARHRVVQRAGTDTPAEDRTVTSAVTAGFAHGDRVVRKADVVVARWTG